MEKYKVMKQELAAMEAAQGEVKQEEADREKPG